MRFHSFEKEEDMANSGNEREMGVLSRIIGIFTSPKETFASIDRKPTWLVPFIIMIVVTMVMQLLIMNIGLQDRVAQMEAIGKPQEQIDATQNFMQGGLKYISLVVAPIGILVVWSVIAGIFLFAGNTIMGGKSTFKKMLSLVSWSSLIGILSVAIQTFLIISKGTRLGVTTSLAAFLPSPTWDAPPSIFYRLLSKLDIFTIWGLVLWAIGISVMYRFTMKKSAILVGSLWVVWIILSVALSGLFASLGM
jgi:hypothetical protein